MKDTGQACKRGTHASETGFGDSSVVWRHGAGRTRFPQRADGELLGGFALEGRFVSTCVRWDGAALLAGWLGERCDVAHCDLSEIAAGFCPRRLLCGGSGVLRRGLRGSPGTLLGVSAQNSSSATGTVMPFSAARLSTSLLTSFRKKLINLPAIRPQAKVAIICSYPLLY